MEKVGAKFLFNVYLPKEDGGTSEIDVLMICPYGLYVFESKNYSGWIFGSERQRCWTQVLPRGRGRSKKTQFLNPIIQNKGHIKYLKSVVGIECTVKSIIVFSERCTFKDLTLKSEEIKVIHRDNVEYTVEEMLKYVPDKVLDEEQCNKIYDKLYPYTQVSEDVKLKHVQSIRKQLEHEQNIGQAAAADNTTLKKTLETETAVNDEEQKPVQEEPVCPRCGGKLVLRKATKGKYAGSSFWGCSNYPKCRYIQNI